MNFLRVSFISAALIVCGNVEQKANAKTEEKEITIVNNNVPLDSIFNPLLVFSYALKKNHMVPLDNFPDTGKSGKIIDSVFPTDPFERISIMYFDHPLETFAARENVKQSEMEPVLVLSCAQSGEAESTDFMIELSKEGELLKCVYRGR